jgi:hypothetical protein
MASTLEGRQLTEAHRRMQARLAATVTRELADAWGALDPLDLDRTSPRFLRLAVPIVQRQNLASSRLASNYLRRYRKAEIGDMVGWVDFLAQPHGIQVVTTSLTVTGPVHLKKATGRGANITTAKSNAQAAMIRAGIRHVLDGGRETITGSVQRDSKALGWARATGGKPCAFCAMLASRGFVYKSKATSDFKTHDGCMCTAEPTYVEDAMLPPMSEQWRKLWDEHTAGASGAFARSEFRSGLAKYLAG